MNINFEFEYQITKEKDQLELDNICVKNDKNIIRNKKLFGYDNIIGENTLFEVSSENLRENVISNKSKTINRFRQIVSTIANINNMDRTRSLEEILCSRYKNKKILLLENNSYFASILIFLCNKNGIDLVTSEYFGGNYKSGEICNGVLNVDIQNTHFPESYFDLIIHSDVLEHVPDAILAEKEQARILAPNGHIVFTVPFNISESSDIIYAKIFSGNIQYLKSPIYHEDPISLDGKCLVFRIFSFADMYRRYNKLNCKFHCDYTHSNYLGIIGINAFVFVVKK
jgi:SAM-dependent methyltransferase